MKVIGIKELQSNPGKLTQAFSEDDYLLITKHGQPIGIALPFSEGIMEQGLKPWLSIKAFQNGDLSLGQLAKALNKSYRETMQMLGTLGIPMADYDLTEDLATVDLLMSA